MKKKQSFTDKIFQNASHPKGFWGRMMLRGMNRFHATLAGWAFSLADWHGVKAVLDIGCGGGANLARLLSMCPDCKAYGIDVSEESVNYTLKKLRKYPQSRYDIRMGEASVLPYEAGMFDAVTAFETVYFWKDLPRAFSEVGRVLRPGGMFLICCEASNPANTEWSDRIEGMRIHSAEELRELLSHCGFADIEVHKGHKEDICIIAHKPSAL